MSEVAVSTAWQYPPADREETVDAHHGVPVADPYRWLEDPRLDRTKQWVAAQNRTARAYLDTLPSRPHFVDLLTALLTAPRAGMPRARAGRYLRYYNDGTTQLDQVWVADDLPTLLTGGRVLIDPAEFSPDDRVALTSASLSPDGRWVVYGVSDAGSDWIEWRVRDAVTGEDTADRVTHAKFLPAVWLPDSTSFLYWAYPEQQRTTGDEVAALGVGQLRRHRIGQRPAADEIIYHRPEAPRAMVRPHVTDDGQWLVLAVSEGTAQRNTVLARRIGADGTLGPELAVVPSPLAKFDFAGADGDLLYLRTDQDAPRCRLVVVNLAEVAAGRPASFRELAGERPELLTRVARAGSGFLAAYLDGGRHRVYWLPADGSARHELPLPELCSVLDWSAKAGESEAFVSVTTFFAPCRSYRLDLSTGPVTVSALDPDEGVGEALVGPTVVERHHAASADGTQVPYTLVRRADSPPGTALPTILYGYGGFNIPVLPAFAPIWPAWVGAGGAIAVANLRGGGEFGREWYEAGTRERKQNVFDDFVAVAEHLVATGVTTSGQLALHGRSNGGLLVGAVMTQRPELAAVALPTVGVFDMLRYHRFTIGWAWIPDLGDPDDPADFEVLRAYSPLHNVREGTAYPATLVVAADQDDRAVPMHSLKFTAAVQHAQAGATPVLCRIEAGTGHGAGKPRRAQLAEAADLLAFAATHTGLAPKIVPGQREHR